MTTNEPIRLGVSHQRPEDLTPDRFRYLRQMGVQSLEVRLPAADADYDTLCRIRDTVTEAGFELFEVMPADLYSFTLAAAGLPGGDEEITRFRTFLASLGRAGIPRTTYAWRTGGAYETGRTTHRESDTRHFAMREVDEAAGDPRPADPVGDEEVWESYERFIGEVLPAAQDSGVRLQLHPNDPPVTHQGIARIFRSTAAFRRAIEIAGGSRYSCILFCVGTWAEMTGPEGSGEDIEAALREFVGSGHVEQIHFRNVSAPLPEFHETYPDEGYLDMPRLFRVLREIGFHGMIVPDHVPIPEGAADGKRLAEGYSFGYIRGLLQATR